MLRFCRTFLLVALIGAMTMQAFARPAFARSNQSLSLGIYPGGGAGTVAGSSVFVEQNQTSRNQALVSLAGRYPLSLHLYTDYTGSIGDYDNARKIISGYPSNMPIDLVVRYKPKSMSQEIKGYRKYISKISSELGPRLQSLQIGNEANISGQPNASDGAYPQAAKAVVTGVVAAHRVARKKHLNLLIGFNWAPCGYTCDKKFFSTLAKSDLAKTEAVDFVGADLYPGTWSSITGAQAMSDPSLAGTELINNLTYLRYTLMPALKSKKSVAIHITENGFPTSSQRSPTGQNKLLSSMFASVQKSSSKLKITSYAWFSLQDANSSSGHMEQGYGIMTTDFVPKPGFFTYQSIIARQGK